MVHDIMENLQDKIDEIPVEGKEEIKPLAYEGLELSNSIEYTGGTSIMYWM